jgi:hypothetical protein
MNLANAAVIALVALSVSGAAVPTATAHEGDHDQVFSEGPVIRPVPR